MKLKNKEIEYLLSPKAIREKAKEIFQATVQQKTHFLYHPEKMEEVVSFVVQVIRENYPDLNIPFHSRWGHFKVGSSPRLALLQKQISSLDALEQARVLLDLVIPSILLDAGAGTAWKYQEENSGQSYSRSEGLGVASFHLFLSGKLSVDGKSLRTDAKGLKTITVEQLKKAFQVSETNPLVGLEGRCQLLKRLGFALENSEFFLEGRPGNLVDYLQSHYGMNLTAPAILAAVLDSLGPIWPGRLEKDGINLGDVWRHSHFDLVPFHKLSQWMTYSLMEPLMDAGFKISKVEELTGLAEYRNGGLIFDSGLISLKDQKELEKTWTPDSDLIIEWRALTIHLLDLIGTQIQSVLGFTPERFPLAKVLEGGTWWAGRRLAQEKRVGGSSPFLIQSDGTVF